MKYTVTIRNKRNRRPLDDGMEQCILVRRCRILMLDKTWGNEGWKTYHEIIKLEKDYA